MPTIHCVISGRVQGVNYRAATRDMASQLGLTGWVRNTLDGNVELTATGPEAALRKLIEWCRQGPPHAAVSNVSTERLPETPFTGFEIRRG
ncbi:MAG TPA: acylphosphatase [Puia sp.]|nr:acylphosphatase [Puia sp.]